MTKPPRAGIRAVIVCYRPDPIILRQTCDSLTASGAKVILVDNTEDSLLESCGSFEDCTVIANEANLGVASAQNIGIREGLRRGAKVIVIFDQDSRIDPDFIGRLLEPIRIGMPDVVAPVSRDARRGFEYAGVRVSRLGLQCKEYSAGRTKPYAVDVVLASGTAATAETFHLAGIMDEALFIDYVDIEWCLRCRARGVSFRIVPSAVMLHSVGDDPVNVGVATVLVHSPIRSYYQIRNCLHLFRLPHVPPLFALRELAVLAVHKATLLLTVREKRAHLATLAAGFRDGLRGVTGAHPDHARAL